jgi:hypothetical protein
VSAWDAAGTEHRGEMVFQDRDAPAIAEGERPGPTPDWGIALKLGVLTTGVEFDSSAVIGMRHIDTGPMFLVRAEGERRLLGPTFLNASLEWADGKDVQVLSAGLGLGAGISLGRWAGMDFEGTLLVGVTFSKLDVDVSGFGDFKTAVGYRYAAEVRAAVAEGWWLDLTVEGRNTRFKFDEDVVSGDTQATISGVSILAGMSWRF